MSTVCRVRFCAPLPFWQGLLDSWLSLEDGDISVQPTWPEREATLTFTYHKGLKSSISNYASK